MHDQVFNHVGITQASDLLRAMCNAKRLQILALLVADEISVGQLAIAVELSQSALSQHLGKLRNWGLITPRRDAQTIYYTCKSPAVKQVLDTLNEIS